VTRLFGTNGIRGVVGREMTADLALAVGMAVGTHFGGGHVAVGRDTRTSSPMLRDACVAGLLAVGCRVTDAGVLPTPALQFAVKEGPYKGGVVVTASHNPAEYNGLKVVDSEGMELPRDEEVRIEAAYDARAFPLASWQDVATPRTDEGAIPRYLEAVLRHVDVERIRRRRLRVVVDCGNGAACLTTPYLLRRLGCEVITLNAQVDGRFPGRPPEPVPAHLDVLLRLVARTEADLGVAHDGDADRAVFVDERGKFVPGDRSLALLAREVVRRQPGTVVTPVSTSSCVEDVVVAAGGAVHYTRVGAPVVARTMYEIGAVFGGEENGGVIHPAHQFCRDGALAAALMIQLLVESETPLSRLLADLPTYHLHKTSVPCPPEAKEAVLARIREATKDREVSAVDGVKVSFDPGWVLVRPSGTEAVFRVFAEGRTPEEAKDHAEEGARLVRDALASQ
jgi:phosphomannomutase/phosphoglucomutase